MASKSGTTRKGGSPPRPISPVVVHHGDNSIVSTVSCPPISKCDSEDTGSLPLMNVLQNLDVTGSQDFHYEAVHHGYVVRGSLTRFDTEMRHIIAPIPIAVLGGFVLDRRLTVRHQVTWGLKLSSYLTDGIESYKNVSSALNIIIRNATLSESLTSYVTTGLTCVDNTAFYVKGGLYAYLQHRIDQEQLAVQYLPFPVDAPIGYYNLADNNAHVAALGALIKSGSFMFLDGRDFNENDLPIVYLLAAEGRHIVPGGIPSLAAMAIHWPTIDITILRHDANAIVAPVPVRIDPEQILYFLYRTATVRGERDFLVAGLHEAMLLVNGILSRISEDAAVVSDLNEYPDTDQLHQLVARQTPNGLAPAFVNLAWYAYSSLLFESFGGHTYPRPAANNVLYRWLNITREEDKAYLGDILTFGNNSRLELLTTGALYSLILSVFVSTILNSVNLYGFVLQPILTDAADANLRAKYIFITGRFFRNGSTMAVIFHVLQSLVHRHLAAHIYLGPLQLRSWNAPQEWGWAGPFDLEPHWPSIRYNALLLTKYLSTFPAEWGLVESQAKANFRDEIPVFGGLGDWRAYRGEQAYKDAQKGIAIYANIPYGQMAINVIYQLLSGIINIAPPNVSWYNLPFDPQGILDPMPLKAHPHPPHWMGPPLSMWEPNTFLTFVWKNEAIISPVSLRLHWVAP